MKLPDDQMVEIGRARERLRAYRDKIQPYPAEPEGDPEPPQEQVIVHRHEHINYNSDVSKKQWYRIDAISNEQAYLRNKLAELQARRKPQTKPPAYKGLTTA